jgi:hypothetical protein
VVDHALAGGATSGGTEDDFPPNVVLANVHSSDRRRLVESDPGQTLFHFSDREPEDVFNNL